MIVAKWEQTAMNDPRTAVDSEAFLTTSVLGVFPVR